MHRSPNAPFVEMQMNTKRGGIKIMVVVVVCEKNRCRNETMPAIDLRCDAMRSAASGRSHGINFLVFSKR